MSPTKIEDWKNVFEHAAIDPDFKIFVHDNVKVEKLASTETFPNLKQLANSIREHTIKIDTNILLANEPKKLLYGWMCEKTGRKWMIRIADIQRVGAIPDSMRAEVSKMIMTKADKLKWANGLKYNEEPYV